MTRPDPASSSAHMVMVFGTGSIPEGLLVRGLLESEGIPVQMKGEAEGPYRMGPVSLWVPEAFEVQARLLLEEASSGRSGTDEPDAPSARTDPD